MELIGLIVLIIGIIIGLVNWPIGIRRIIKKAGTSSVPLVGSIFMLLGVMLMPSGTYKPYMWLIPFIDFGCLPLLTYGLLKGKFN